MERSPSLGRGPFFAKGRPLPNTREQFGPNRKRFFKYNLHNSQNSLHYGSNNDIQKPELPPMTTAQDQEMYWSEYRLNYEKQLEV